MPVSDKNVSETKVAAVCFISDTAACSDNQFGGSGDSDFGLSDKDRAIKNAALMKALRSQIVRTDINREERSVHMVRITANVLRLVRRIM